MTTQDTERLMTLAVPCPFCGNVTELEVPFKGFLAYRNGAYIQDAFPSLSADDRELVKTGICVPCWDKTFPDSDE